ncbi:hypothetical protein [Enterobacter kobei]|uniref:hypothetical protein n=1 Tax=Enterobacter kobei TaxID=208224 RepID=UPI0021BEA65F|nr:hypothetical protein [Enterobacter kobei]UXJ66741.1 hypothetical protein N5P26_22395 [Enterobacter kobei]HCR0386837.1 hypothetical protein [Enterobacter kobei]
MANQKGKAIFDLDEAIEAGTPLGISKTSNYRVVSGHHVPDKWKIRGDFEAVGQDLWAAGRDQKIQTTKGSQRASSASKSMVGDKQNWSRMEQAHRRGFEAGAKNPVAGSSNQRSVQKEMAGSRASVNERTRTDGQVKSKNSYGEYPSFGKYADLYARTKR